MDEIAQLLPRYSYVIAALTWRCRSSTFMLSRLHQGTGSQTKMAKFRAAGSWQLAWQDFDSVPHWRTFRLPKPHWEGAAFTAIQKIVSQPRLSALTLSTLATDKVKNVRDFDWRSSLGMHG